MDILPSLPLRRSRLRKQSWLPDIYIRVFAEHASDF